MLAEPVGEDIAGPQTANPTGWRWTVDLAPPFRSRTGETLQRIDAVRKALAVINNLVLPLVPKI